MSASPRPSRLRSLAVVPIACVAVLALSAPDARAHGSTSNGCGSSGMSGRVPDRVPGSYDFHAACDRHDRNYGKWNFGKARADDIFYKDMLANCGKYFGPNLRCKAAARTYLQGVRTRWGVAAYRSAQRKAGLSQPLKVAFTVKPASTTTNRFTQFWANIGGGHYSSLTCLLDGRVKTPCQPVMKFAVAPGMHRYQVIARNRAGTFASPVHHWMVR